MLDVTDITQALGGLSASVQKMQQMVQDYQRLAQLVNKLTEENQRLREELSAVRAERDEYETALRYQSSRETAITVEDLREMEQSGLGARELLNLIQGQGRTPDGSTS